MATSDITSGIGVEDLNATAGFKALYVANFDDYEFTTTEDETDGILLTGLPVDFEVYKFPLKNVGNTYSEPSSSSRDNGTTTFNGTLAAVFTKISAKKSFQLRQMVWGRPIVFAETNGGEILAIGLRRGVEFNNTAAIAGEMDGANSYTMEGISQEAQPAYFLDAETITALKAAVVTPL
jgi:hypothetical protein